MINQLFAHDKGLKKKSSAYSKISEYVFTLYHAQRQGIIMQKKHEKQLKSFTFT